MSKEIAQTVGGKRIAWLIAIVAAFAVLATVVTQWGNAHAADPPVDVSFTKTADTQGAFTFFTLRIQNNSGLIPSEEEGSDAEEQIVSNMLVRDFLPDIGSWTFHSAIANDGEGQTTDFGAACVVDPDGVTCNLPPIRGVHINSTKTGLVAGSATIVIYGQIGAACVQITNSAILFNAGTLLPKTASASAGTACPTATATPTSVPPTVTAIPTSTPVPPTSVPSATPTIRIAPLPPNTGDSNNANAESAGDSPAAWLYSALLIGAVAFATGGWIISRRSAQTGEVNSE